MPPGYWSAPSISCRNDPTPYRKVELSHIDLFSSPDNRSETSRTLALVGKISVVVVLASPLRNAQSVAASNVPLTPVTVTTTASSAIVGVPDKTPVDVFNDKPVGQIESLTS